MPWEQLAQFLEHNNRNGAPQCLGVNSTKLDAAGEKHCYPPVVQRIAHVKSHFDGSKELLYQTRHKNEKLFFFLVRPFTGRRAGTDASLLPRR